jgi:hypothetical protein
MAVVVVVDESPVTPSGRDAAVLEMDPSAGVSWGIKLGYGKVVSNEMTRTNNTPSNLRA